METIERIWTTLTAAFWIALIALWVALAAVVASLVAIGTWTNYFDTAPPKIIMATGPENLSYRKYGQCYQKALKGRVDSEPENNRTPVDFKKPGDECDPGALKGRVDVGLVQSNGSPENVTLLLDAKTGVKAALIQGDTIADASKVPDLESLGTVFYEPLWLFRRREVGNEGASPQEGLNGLRGKRIAIGPKDSGTQHLVSALLARHQITDQNSALKPLDTVAAVKELRGGTVDAAFFSTAPSAEAVKELAGDPQIELVGYPQADAYRSSFPFLHTVVLYRGVIDLANDQPRADVHLVATKANLIVRKDLASTIQYRLLKAAGQIHAEPEIRLGPDKFPSEEAIVPLSVAAREFYHPGPFYELNSFVADLSLPLWIDELIIKTLHSVVARLTVGVLSLPLLIRLLFMLLNWWRQLPVSKLRHEVMALEEELRSPVSEERAGEIARELKLLDETASELLRRRVGATHNHPLVMLLQERIDALRQKVERLHPPSGPGPVS
jgi:TRAP-type uncharacterized transport system substrate-binding protein